MCKSRIRKFSKWDWISVWRFLQTSSAYAFITWTGILSSSYYKSTPATYLPPQWSEWYTNDLITRRVICHCLTELVECLVGGFCCCIQRWGLFCNLLEQSKIMLFIRSRMMIGKSLLSEDPLKSYALRKAPLGCLSICAFATTTNGTMVSPTKSLSLPLQKARLLVQSLFCTQLSLAQKSSCPSKSIHYFLRY